MIQKQTFSAAASVQFTNLNLSGFSSFNILMTNMTQSASVAAYLRISTDGSTYIATGYLSDCNFNNVTTSTWTNANATVGILINPGFTQVASSNYSVELDLLAIFIIPTFAIPVVALKRLDFPTIFEAITSLGCEV